MSVYAGKYVTEDNSKTETTKTKHNPGKANNTKQPNKTSLVLTALGQETRWAYSTTLPSPHGANQIMLTD